MGDKTKGGIWPIAKKKVKENILGIKNKRLHWLRFLRLKQIILHIEKHIYQLEQN